MIDNWEREILNRLVSIYEHRYHFGSTFKQRIVIKFNSGDFHEYTNPVKLDDPQSIDVAVVKLEKLQYIDVIREKYTGLIERVALNLKLINDIYRYLGKKNIDDVYQNYYNVLQLYDCKILNEFREYLIQRQIKNKTIKNFLLEESTQNDVFLAIQAIENIDKDILIRNLSMQLFQDSKRLESLLPRIEAIYRTVILDFDENYFILKGLLKNPTYIFIKGDSKFMIGDYEIDLSKINSSIGFHSDLVDIISFKNLEQITTVENLTTFNTYKSNGIIVYLGGFSNHVQNRFLKRVVEAKAELIHFGDIDYGGFLILYNIYNNIGVLPKTVNMDIQSLREKKKYCKDISHNDDYKRKLKSLLEKDVLKQHFDTIKYLLEYNVILEQEAFD